MNVGELLVEGFGRINQLVHQATDGVGMDGLMYRPEPGANSIAWLVWHLTRVQDDHVSHLQGVVETWPNWMKDTGIEVEGLGQGDGPDEVGALRPISVDALLRYHDAVHPARSNTCCRSRKQIWTPSSIARIPRRSPAGCDS